MALIGPIIGFYFLSSPYSILLQCPGNPFESMYSQSVLAAQNSASFIIRTTARYLEKAPESILRHWDVWVDVSSTAVSIPIPHLVGSEHALIQINWFLFRLSAITCTDHRRFDRGACPEYAILRDERFGSCNQDLGERVRQGSAREWFRTLQRSSCPPY